MLERIVRTTVKEGGAGPLCDYLCRRFTYHSPETWRGLLEEGRVLLDGAVASGGETLTAGMEIQYMPRPVPEPEVSFDAKLLFQDDAYIVIDKPANLPCHPAGCFFNNTLWAALKQGMVDGLPPMDEIHFVSRLDRETSGIVLLAKTSADASRAIRMLRSGGAVKAYHVLVEGDFPDSLSADGWIYNETNANISKKRTFSFDRPSNANVRNLETASTFFDCSGRGNGMSLLRARLATGRTHQIRATLSSLGFPVVGDKIYGVDETIFLRFLSHGMTDSDRRLLRMPRQALHASELSFGNYRFFSDSDFREILK